MLLCKKNGINTLGGDIMSELKMPQRRPKNLNGGRPCKFTPLEELSIVSDYENGKRVLQIAYERNSNEKTIRRLIKKYADMEKANH